VEDKKAEDIILLDLRPDAIVADFFVICNGNSDRHIKALVEDVRQKMKDDHSMIPFSVEGTGESGWVLMDYSSVVVHVFAEEKRNFYDLEGLYRPDSKIMLSIQ
jgi:ribosome-associated protein